jgi:hypothetical protein
VLGDVRNFATPGVNDGNRLSNDQCSRPKVRRQKR